MTEINKVNTSCKNCVFAVYKDITQIDCKIKKVDMWRQQDIKILEAYDEDKEFFIINKKKCPYKRTRKWGDVYPKDEWEIRVEKEVVFKYHAIVIANNDVENTALTINSLVNQSIPPQFITLVRLFNNTTRPSSYIPLLQRYNIPWKMENITDSEINILEIIDMIMTFSKVPYYAVFNSGLTFDTTTFDEINNLVKTATPFVLVEPDSGVNGLIVHSLTHRLLRGNKGENLTDKIETLQKEQQTEKAILKLSDICPLFPQN